MIAERFADDPTIAHKAELWRRIHPMWVVRDDNTGSVRVASAAFDNSPDGSPTSVLLADVLEHAGRSAGDVLARFAGYSLASVTAGHARQCGQAVRRDPLRDEPAHALIDGPKTKQAKRCLARSAQWVIQPHPSAPDT